MESNEIKFPLKEIEVSIDKNDILARTNVIVRDTCKERKDGKHNECSESNCLCRRNNHNIR
jgi:hypothetical protein